MNSLTQRLPVLVAAFWWASLATVGFIVVPLLFSHLPTATAGQTAARLFTAQAWVSIACAMLLLVLSRADHGGAALAVLKASLGVLLLGFLLALLGEFAVAPRIVARQNLKLWHSVGSAMYLVQWVCAGVVLWRLSRPSAAAQS